MENNAQIQLRQHCPRCGGEAKLIRGLREAVDDNPRSLWPGFFLLGVFLLGAMTAWLMELVLNYFTQGAWHTDLISKLVGFVVVAPLLIRAFPLRMLVCTNCRRAIKSGFGRCVPLSWQYYIHPHLRCLCCDYSLVGITEEPRCPECGHPFPPAWLEATRAAAHLHA